MPFLVVVLLLQGVRVEKVFEKQISPTHVVSLLRNSTQSKITFQIRIEEKANHSRFWDLTTLETPFGYEFVRADTGTLVLRGENDYGFKGPYLKLFFDLESKKVLKRIEYTDTALAQIPNAEAQRVLGVSEEIINRLSKVIETIIEKEHDARQILLQKKPDTLWDQVGRAYGVLTYAHAMASKEALNLLSIIKLGVDLGAFPEEQRLPIDELFIDTQPAHLQKSSQQKLNAEERDHLRAQIIRDRLKLFPKPDISKMARQSGNGSANQPSNNE